MPVSPSVRVGSHTHRTIPKCGQNLKSKLIVAAWNVRTMLDRNETTDRPARRTALIAQELARYQIDIAALSETRLADEGSLTEDQGAYTFFWKGLPLNEQRIHGVGFAIKSSLLKTLHSSPTGISERLMRVRVPLSNNRFATIFSCYAPTLAASNEDSDTFYARLDSELRQTAQSDKIILLGDFNARVGNNYLAWQNVLGRHGIGKINMNGHRLLTLCAQNNLFITNTGFQLKDVHKGTWTHPRSKHAHMIDYCIIRQRDREDVLITRAMRGADCWTDHFMLRSKLSLRIRPPTRKKAANRKLNCDALNSEAVKQRFQDAMTARLDNTLIPGIEEGWKSICTTAAAVAEDVLGPAPRKNQDWFDSNLQGIQEILNNKKKALAASLCNPSSIFLRDKYKEARANCQRILRDMENEWWLKLAADIQGYADSGDLQNFHSALKQVYGPSDRSLAPVRSRDGSTLFTEKDDILKRWREHYSVLLNTNNPSNRHILDRIPQKARVTQMDVTPTLQEVENAVRNLKNHKSPGVDGIPSEVWKHGGSSLTGQLHQLICRIWAEEEVPQHWRDARLISIYKKKGDRATCGNSRGIALLSVAGKVLAKIMITRLNQHITDSTCPESQCGFRRERGTSDMIFVSRQLQEKCREQRKDLCIAFIDLSKAFDTVNREFLWEIMRRAGCPDKFTNIVKAFHDQMHATVVIGGEETESFDVGVGVKQGCVMAPVIFNIYLAAATRLFRESFPVEQGIGITFRLDGSIFNLSRLKARTKVNRDFVTELQYADDCALVAHTPEDLQQSIIALCSIYSAMGLAVNTEKTEVLHQWFGTDHPVPPEIRIGETVLKTTNQFCYLGSILSSNCSVDAEINSRIGKACAAFAKLRKNVIHTHNLRLATRVAVYKAICISTLLYGLETMTLYRRHIILLERFHMNCIKEMLGLTWQDKVTHNEMLQRTELQCIEGILAKAQLRWSGHVFRMPDDRLPKRVLYGQLTEGTRLPQGPKKRFKDQLKQSLKSFQLSPNNFEEDAGNRTRWRSLCHQGLEHFETSRADMRDLRRQRRHEARLADPPADDQFRCPECGRLCRSRIGLFSHRRTHGGTAAGRVEVT